MIVLQNNSRLFRVFGNLLVAWDDGSHACNMMLLWECYEDVAYFGEQPIEEQIPQIVGDDDSDEERESDERGGSKVQHGFGRLQHAKQSKFSF
jgi:hypothetical protein